MGHPQLCMVLCVILMRYLLSRYKIVYGSGNSTNGMLACSWSMKQPSALASIRKFKWRESCCHRTVKGSVYWEDEEQNKFFSATADADKLTIRVDRARGDVMAQLSKIQKLPLRRAFSPYSCSLLSCIDCTVSVI